MVEVVVIGAGKWALECWAELLVGLRDCYTVRAVVDPRHAAARQLATAIGLDPAATFTTLDAAPGVQAGIVLTPPDQHADSIVALARHGRHILTEKPLATSRAQLDTLTHAVRSAGARLAVIQNYRYQTRIQTARDILRSGELGALAYLVARFAADYRRPGSWDVGQAHTMAHPLLIKGTIHHLDMIRYLTGQNVHAVAAMTRNPGWSSFAGDAIGAFPLRLADGALALYEANLLAAGSQHGSLTCHGPTLTITRGDHTTILDVPDPDPRRGHRTIARAFATWLTGGPKVETDLDDNRQSLLVMLAALEAATTATLVPVSQHAPTAPQPPDTPSQPDPAAG